MPGRGTWECRRKRVLSQAKRKIERIKRGYDCNYADRFNVLLLLNALVENCMKPFFREAAGVRRNAMNDLHHGVRHDAERVVRTLYGVR